MALSLEGVLRAQSLRQVWAVSPWSPSAFFENYVLVRQKGGLLAGACGTPLQCGAQSRPPGLLLFWQHSSGLPDAMGR